MGDSEGHIHGQLVIGSFIVTACPLMNHVLHRVFWWNIKSQVTQAPYSPDLAPCDFWLFPKLKSPSKGKKNSDHWWDSGKYDGAPDRDWENCVRSQDAYTEGDWESGKIYNTSHSQYASHCLRFHGIRSSPRMENNHPSKNASVIVNYWLFRAMEYQEISVPWTQWIHASPCKVLQ